MVNTGTLGEDSTRNSNQRQENTADPQFPEDGDAQSYPGRCPTEQASGTPTARTG